MSWRTIDLDRGDIGVRVDLVVLRHLHDVAGISRTQVQRMVARGAVLVNNQAAPRASWRIAAGDAVRVEVPAAIPRQVPTAEPLPIDILFEDRDLLIVNKPAGQVVHPAYRNATATLLNALLHHLDAGNTAEEKPSLVHRLDKLTSGLLLVAKRRAVHRSLQHAMNANRMDKDYLAVVYGGPTPRHGTIDLALDRDPWDRRRVMVRDRGGQSSITRYERLAMSRHSEVALVRCRLITGRTHQIRVHLAAMGWPIIGDTVYGSKADLRFRDEALGETVRQFPRQALHAWRLSFDHPCTGERIEATAPIPADMKRLLEVARLDRGI